MAFSTRFYNSTTRCRPSYVGVYKKHSRYLSRTLVSQTSVPVAPSVIKKDQDQYTKFVSHLRRMDELPQTFVGLMEQYDLTPAQTCQNLINTYLEDNDHDAALHLVRDMKKHNIDTTTKMYNSILSIFKGQFLYQKVFDVWEEMKQENVPCDNETYQILLAVSEGREQFGKIVADLVQQFSEDQILAIVLDAFKSFRKVSNIGATLELFYLLGNNGIHPSAPIYTSLIETFGKLNDSQNIIKFFKKMRERDFTPSTNVYNIVINVYGEQGDVSKITELENEMAQLGVPQNGVTEFLRDIYVHKKDPQVFTDNV